jgi:hypothetical protein
MKIDLDKLRTLIAPEKIEEFEMLVKPKYVETETFDCFDLTAKPETEEEKTERLRKEATQSYQFGKIEGLIDMLREDMKTIRGEYLCKEHTHVIDFLEDSLFPNLRESIRAYKEKWIKE